MQNCVRLHKKQILDNVFKIQWEKVLMKEKPFSSFVQ